MTTPPASRSVKISDDERGGWSSDRPRRDGAPPRPADVSVRSRVLVPSDRLRYSPGSLVLVVSPTPGEPDRFARRLVEGKDAVLSLERVRGLLAGRVAEEEVEDRAAELLNAAVLRRLHANEAVAVAAEGLGAAERERYVRMAAQLRRPRHLILVETGREGVHEDDRDALNALRRRLDANELGAEGFHTALRLSGRSIAEVRAIVFQSAPRDE
jgi:predicted kinase